MPSPRSLFRLMPLGLVFGFTVAGATPTPPSAPEIAGAAARPVVADSPQRQQALTRSRAWRQFEAQHGRWTVMWNELTDTPHRAFGRGIPLAGFGGDAPTADRAVRRFIDANPDLFGPIPDLETLASQRAGNLWFVRYRQAVRGVPVLNEDWEFRVRADGRLVAFGADRHRVPADVNTTPRIGEAQARAAASSGVIFNPLTDRVEGGTSLYLLPYRTGTGTEYRLVYDVRVRTASPPGNWITLVDAADGEVLSRRNHVFYANVSGHVTGKVHPLLPTDALTAKPFPHLYVNVGAQQGTTDATGAYSAICTGTSTVTAALAGQYCHIMRLDPPNAGLEAAFSRSVSCPSTRDIAWDTSNSLTAEVDAYYHINLAHDYVKGLDPSYTGNDDDLTVNINSVDDECSQYWDGHSLTFGINGSTCLNMASLPDIVYHEYGHRVSDNLYFSQGSTFGLQNAALAEGLADVFSAFMTDDPVIGNGVEGSGTSLRDISQLHRWPEDRSGDPNEEGLILAGAFWELRQSVGLSTAEQLAHFAQYGIPDDDDDGVAMSELFVETLVADDDDPDISNGTPHFSQIDAAFSNHGIGTNYFLTIDHTALVDQQTGGPYPIKAVIRYTGPRGSLDTGSPTLHFKVNNLDFVSETMLPTGNPDEYGAEVPGQSGSIVRYYITASESNGGSKVEPPGAPARAMDVFVAGPASVLTSEEMESDPGWTVGDSDNASTGLWVRVDPVATIAQPGDDHTTAGTMCWVTGNANPSDPPGLNDVDGGKTTLKTSVFDATFGGFISYPVISYYRWYSNNAGEAPSTDFWNVDISNNGGASWVNVENTSDTDQFWRRVVFFIKDYVTPTNNMRMRFVASDLGLPSLIEAGVDDFSLLGYVDPVAVGGREVPRVLALAPAAPNPFQVGTSLRYTLPAAGRVDLSVFDIHGRLVRSLIAADQVAGPHAAEWDGRDGSGRPVASGPYFLRLLQSGHRSTQAVVRIR